METQTNEDIEYWIKKAREKLTSLKESGSCRFPPSDIVISEINSTLSYMFEKNIKPTRISPMAGGGASIHLFRGDIYIRIEFGNEGERVCMTMYPENEREYFEFTSFEEVVQKLLIMN